MRPICKEIGIQTATIININTIQAPLDGKSKTIGSILTLIRYQSKLKFKLEGCHLSEYIYKK
jgi:hypothetical protein